MDATLTQAAWHKIAFFFACSGARCIWQSRSSILFRSKRRWVKMPRRSSTESFCAAETLAVDVFRIADMSCPTSAVRLASVFSHPLRVVFNACPVPRVFCSSIFWQLLLWYDVKRLLSRASPVRSVELLLVCWRHCAEAGESLVMICCFSPLCTAQPVTPEALVELVSWRRRAKVLHTHVNLLLHFHTDVMLRTIDSIWTQVKESILCSLSSKFPQISTHIRSFQWRFTFVENSNLLKACGHELSEGQSGEKGKDATARVWFVKTCWKTRFL